LSQQEYYIYNFETKLNLALLKYFVTFEAVFWFGSGSNRSVPNYLASGSESVFLNN